MNKPFGDEALQYRAAVARVEIPEAAGLLEGESKARHFQELTANPGEEEIVSRHGADAPDVLGRRVAGGLDHSTSAATQGCTQTRGDSGPGIPADVREKIFTPFFTTKTRGSGLGLPTAKRLIDTHQGTIRIDCPPGGGATVTVRLPFTATPAAGPVLENI